MPNNNRIKSLTNKVAAIAGAALAALVVGNNHGTEEKSIEYALESLSIRNGSSTKPMPVLKLSSASDYSLHTGHRSHSSHSSHSSHRSHYSHRSGMSA